MVTPTKGIIALITMHPTGFVAAGSLLIVWLAWMISLPILVFGMLSGAVVVWLSRKLCAAQYACEQSKHDVVALRSEYDCFRYMLENTPAMLWAADVHGKRTYVNKGWLTLTGRRLEDELGEGWTDSIPLPDRREYRYALHRAVDARESFRVEYRLRLNDGRECWMDDRAEPVYLTDGSFVGYVGVAMDITARRSHQLDQQRELTAMRSRISSLEDDLAAAQTTIDVLQETAELARTTIEQTNPSLSAIADDVRRALHDVICMTNLLRDDDSIGPQCQYAINAGDSAIALVELLGPMIDFNLPETRSQPSLFKEEEFDFRETIELLAEQLIERYSVEPRTLVVIMAPDVPALVRGKKNEVSELIEIIVNQAIALTETGETTLSIRSGIKDDASIQICLDVEHHLRGLHSDELEALFCQSVSDDGDKPDTGSNLLVARHLTQTMEGRLDVESVQGERFEFRCVIKLGMVKGGNQSRRVHGRLPLEFLRCNLGQILDLSLGGMRIECRKVPEGEVNVLIETEHDEPLALRGEVLWSRRIGLRKHEVGIKFLGLTNEMTLQLTRLSIDHGVRSVIETV